VLDREKKIKSQEYVSPDGSFDLEEGIEEEMKEMAEKRRMGEPDYDMETV
jgi:hypothetical protein